jgi:hypothetical protein
LWIALGSLKALDPRALAEGLRARVSPALELPLEPLAWAMALGEVALGLWIVLARGTWQRRALALSACLAAGALLFASLEPRGLPTCGCFGGAVASTQARRLVVGGALLWLSITARGRRAPATLPAEALGRGQAAPRT